MKFLTRLFLSLFFLLLSGYDAVHAHQEHSGHAPTWSFESTAYTSLSIVESSPAPTVRSVPSSRIEKSHDKIDLPDSEDDDDDPISFKSDLATSDHHTGLYYAHTPAYLCHCHKERLPFRKHFSCYSSGKYIVFRVMRI